MRGAIPAARWRSDPSVSRSMRSNSISFAIALGPQQLRVFAEEQRVLAPDRAGLHEGADREVEQAHALSRSGLQDRVDLEGLVLADQVLDGLVHDEGLERDRAPRAVGARQ